MTLHTNPDMNGSMDDPNLPSWPIPKSEFVPSPIPHWVSKFKEHGVVLARWMVYWYEDENQFKAFRLYNEAGETINYYRFTNEEALKKFLWWVVGAILSDDNHISLFAPGGEYEMTIDMNDAFIVRRLNGVDAMGNADDQWLPYAVEPSIHRKQMHGSQPMFRLHGETVTMLPSMTGDKRLHEVESVELTLKTWAGPKLMVEVEPENFGSMIEALTEINEYQTMYSHMRLIFAPEAVKMSIEITWESDDQGGVKAYIGEVLAFDAEDNEVDQKSMEEHYAAMLRDYLQQKDLPYRDRANWIDDALKMTFEGDYSLDNPECIKMLDKVHEDWVWEKERSLGKLNVRDYPDSDLSDEDAIEFDSRKKPELWYSLIDRRFRILPE